MSTSSNELELYTSLLLEYHLANLQRHIICLLSFSQNSVHCDLWFQLEPILNKCPGLTDLLKTEDEAETVTTPFKPF